MSTNILPTALLNVLSCSLGAVTEQLRAVIIDLQNDNTCFIRFYHDEEISEKTYDLWDCALAEIDIEGYRLKVDIQRLDYPKEIPSHGILAFLRKEPILPKYLKSIKESFKLPFSGEKYFYGNIRSAMQNALLGAITPNIREIDLTYNSEYIFVHFYYKGEIRSEDEENMKEIMNYFIPHFSSFTIHLYYFRIDQSKTLPAHDISVFARYNEILDNTPFYIPPSKRLKFN